MPMTQFLGAAFDTQLRRLILFTNTTQASAGLGQDWIRHQMVVHVFTVQNSVIWQGNTTINSGDMQWNKVASLSYNTQAKRGVLVSEVIFDPQSNGLVQTLSVFDASVQAPYISERISTNFSVMEPQIEGQGYPEQIIKSDISEEGFIYVLQGNGHMVVYEAFDYYQIITLTHTITKRWEQDFSGEVGSGVAIHDFDILEGSYILLYTGAN